MLKELQKKIRKLADPKKAEVLARYFKTGKGEYGEGDVFIGLMVPQSRLLAKSYKDLPLSDIRMLLESKIHEERLIALFILTQRFENAEKKEKEKFYSFYMNHRKFVNNWDLVDLSAPHIVGSYLIDRPKTVLYDLAKSKNLWDRRIAVLATFVFIKQNSFSESLKIGTLLLDDSHELMHKAVGWMLREVGKRDPKALDTYLRKHYQDMPRTTLRYALEHYPKSTRLAYMKGTV